MRRLLFQSHMLKVEGGVQSESDSLAKQLCPVSESTCGNVQHYSRFPKITFGRKEKKRQRSFGRGVKVTLIHSRKPAAD